MASLHMLLQVRNGEVAERVATEGVMLQYAVDAKLDELLAAVWTALTGGGRGGCPDPMRACWRTAGAPPGGLPSSMCPCCPSSVLACIPATHPAP